MFKRLGFVFVGGLIWLVILVVPALAGSELNQPGGTQVRGEVVLNGPGGTAFTGANITMGALIAAVLLVTGVALLFASRRRAAAG